MPTRSSRRCSVWMWGKSWNSQANGIRFEEIGPFIEESYEGAVYKAKKGFIVPAWGPDNEAKYKNLYPPLHQANYLIFLSKIEC